MQNSSTQASVADARMGDVLHPSFQDTSIVALLRQRALLQPTRLAYKFLKYTQTRCSERDWTYHELDQQARLIGAVLMNLGAYQQPVLLFFPSGLEYVAAFFGCFYAGAIAVPAYPPRHARSIDRIGSILEDARPAVILTTASLRSNVQEWLTLFPFAANIPLIAVDALDETVADAWQAPVISRDSLAFLQYTSGSTASPKGVMVSHGNLLHNSALIQHYSRTDAHDICISWLPIYHDMGLIANIIQPAYVGYPVIFMDPVQFLQFPMRWLYAISRHRGTIAYAPNFAFEQCVRRVKPQDIASLDLSCWRGVANGAEPIRVETLERFVDTFLPCGLRPDVFVPCYGLAEGTLVVTSNFLGNGLVTRAFDKQALAQNRVVRTIEQDACAQKLVGCGSPALGQKVTIVHPDDRTRCMPNEIGEIWVQGESIAQGYWRNDDATDQTFHAYLSDSLEGPFMRTGDLGFFHGESLYITGRIKDVIILNGRNHYPQDIELVVEKSHPALRPEGCVAFSIEQDGIERLVVMAEVNPRYRRSQDQQDFSSNDLQGRIRQSIADAHDIRAHEVVLLQAGEVLKTSSGKLQRRACKDRYLLGELNRWSEK